MKILITGAKGFIGSALFNHFLDNGLDTYGLSRCKTRNNLENNSRDICSNFQDLTVADLSKYNILIHLAAVGISPRQATWEECMNNNFYDVIDLIKKAFKSGIKKIIITGTFAEYGKTAEYVDFLRTYDMLVPEGPYATSKALLGLSLKNLEIPEGYNIAYIRLFSVFGENQNKVNLYPQIKDCAKSDKDFETTFGEQVRDFIHIDEVCQRIEDLVLTQFAEKLIYLNIGSGKGTRVRDFIEYWWSKFKAKGVVKYGVLPYRENEKMRFVSDQSEFTLTKQQK